MKHPAVTPIVLITLLAANPAQASSSDAWEAFRNAVKPACAAASGLDPAAGMRVDPFGTET